MKPVGPTAESRAALSAVADKVVASVWVPEGYFHEFKACADGYDVSMLRIVFNDADVAEFGSEILTPLDDPWCEVPVLSASLNPPPRKRMVSWGPDPDQWSHSELFSTFLAGQCLGQGVDYETEVYQWSPDIEALAVAAGIEFVVKGHPVRLLVLGDGVPIAAMVISSPALPRIQEKPTGRSERFSQQWARSRSGPKHP